MPVTISPTTFVSPLEGAPCEFEPASPIPTPELAMAIPQTTHTQQPSPDVILLPETGAGLDGLIFAVVFAGFCAFSWWAGRVAKR
jgi:hypothetical protein